MAYNPYEEEIPGLTPPPGQSKPKVYPDPKMQGRIPKKLRNDSFTYGSERHSAGAAIGKGIHKQVTGVAKTVQKMGLEPAGKSSAAIVGGAAKALHGGGQILKSGVGFASDLVESAITGKDPKKAAPPAAPAATEPGVAPAEAVAPPSVTPQPRQSLVPPLLAKPEEVQQEPTAKPPPVTAGLGGRGSTPGAPAAQKSYGDGAPAGSTVVIKGTDVYYTDPDKPEVLLPALPGKSVAELREAKALQDGGYALDQKNDIERSKVNALQTGADADTIRAIAASSQSGLDENGNLRQFVTGPDGEARPQEGFTPIPPPTPKSQLAKVQVGGPGSSEQTLKIDGDQVENLSQTVINQEIANGAKLKMAQNPGISRDEAIELARAELEELYGQPVYFQE